MKNCFLVLAMVGLAGSAIAAGAPASPAPELPTVKGVKALASVQGEPIAWSSFMDALATVHTDADTAGRRAKQDPQALLERLITAKLIAQEARTIGLDQTPEFKAAVATFRQETMSRMLLERAAESVKKSDPADVERFYRAAVGLAKFDSLLFEKQADADTFKAKVTRGADFGASARDAVAAGQSKGFDQGGGGKLAELQPEIARALGDLKPGQVSPVIAIPQGWMVAKMVEVSVPDDPAARLQAEQDALEWKRLQAVSAYTTGLRKRYVTIDQKLFDAIDFEAEKPGLAGAKSDKRVVATIQGGKSITVGDLATEVDKAFFHGTEKAAKDKRINAKKFAALDELLVRRLTVLEGTRTGIDKTPEFREAARENEEGELFSAFLTKVVVPEIKMTEAEVKSWYEGHKAEFSSPSMLRLESIAFTGRAPAEDARKKAQSGADFAWLAKNAPGRAPADAPVLRLTGGPYVLDQVEPNLAKALASPKTGEIRVYASAQGPAYVILVRDVIPPKTQSFDEVKNVAAQAVVNEKTRAVLVEWTSNLRKAYEVKTFVTPAQLDALIQKEIGRKA